MINNFSIEEVRQFWDSVSPIYESSNSKVGYVHIQRFEKALEFGDVKPGQTILNIWSRTGSLIPYIRKQPNINLHNREVSPKMAEIAKNKFPEENFKLTDLKDLSDFSDNTFDRIFSLETLEHTPEPLKLLQEFNRTLKPGGILIMSLPPKGFEIPTRIYDLFFENHGEGPHRFLWPKEVKSLLKESGLTLSQHKPAIILPLISDRLTRLSEKILTGLFGRTPIANFGVRHFYICKK